MNQAVDLQIPEQRCLMNKEGSAKDKQCLELGVGKEKMTENDENKTSWVYRIKENIKRFKNITLLLIYLGYYAYAMYCNFGDEESIRLTVLTGFILAYLSWNKAFDQECVQVKWTSFLHCLRSMYSYGKRPIVIQWFLYVVVTALFVSYLTINVALKEPEKLRSLSGILVFIFILLISSNNRRKINWHCVFWGITLQCLLGYFVIRSNAGIAAITWFSNRLAEFTKYADAGSRYVFGASFKDHKFVMQLMPAVLLFCAVINALIYLGAIKFVVETFGKLLAFVLKVSAPEAINACANIALNGIESIVLVKEYINAMPTSGLFALITNWFASCNGSVLIMFMSFGVPLNYLLAASAMSAPAALASAKLAYPDDGISDLVNETTDTGLEVLTNEDKDVDLPESGEKKGDITILNEQQSCQQDKYVQNEKKDEMPTKLLHDKANSIWDALVIGTHIGMKLIVRVIGILIVSLALIEFTNQTIKWFGNRVNLQVNLNVILGYMFYAFAYVMGVDVEDCLRAGGLLGIRILSAPGASYLFLGKIIENRHRLEDYITSFNHTIIYNRADDIFLPQLNQTLFGGVFTERSEQITTYALCGMASLPNIGVTLGAVSAIIPQRATEISKVAFKAMLTGTIASFLTACIAGLLS